MTVYADVLIILNFIIDYFLLRITDVLLKCRAKTSRVLISALLGGIFSLYIFFPFGGAVVSVFAKAVFCLVMTAVCFGFKSLSRFIRCAAVFTLITFSFGGIMIAVYYAFLPQNMIINNSVVYFDFSPLVLILSATAFYLTAMLIKALFGKKTYQNENCEVFIRYNGGEFKMQGIIDTGNGITDVFTNGAVFIIDKKAAGKIFGGSTALKSRYRAIPYKTVSGQGVLCGYRTDGAKILYGKKTVNLKNVITAVSETSIPESSAIINPCVLE